MLASDAARTTARPSPATGGSAAATSPAGPPRQPLLYNGALAYGAVYTTALTAARVGEHYLTGRP